MFGGEVILLRPVVMPKAQVQHCTEGTLKLEGTSHVINYSFRFFFLFLFFGGGVLLRLCMH